MDHRRLGRSGLMVPVLTLGTATFGGTGPGFAPWGATQVDEARDLVDICLEAGLTMFDSADVYSAGNAETILGQAIKGRRDRVLISTKATFAHGPGPNDRGSSRHALVRAVEAALRRLQTDYIDLFQLHGFDAMTPLEEVMHTLDDLVTAGKIRYVGCSNFSGWHLMKALAVSDRHGWVRHVAHQAYYSLLGRDYEWDLMPLALDQEVGAVVWSPLGWGRLSGRYRRSHPFDGNSRAEQTRNSAPPVTDAHVYDVMDVLDAIAAETGKSVPQIALNWVLGRPSVATLIIGARHAGQLRDNLGAVGWSLTPDQTARLNDVSRPALPYPNWHQASFDRNPPPV